MNLVIYPIILNSFTNKNKISKNLRVKKKSQGSKHKKVILNRQQNNLKIKTKTKEVKKIRYKNF